MEMTILLLSPFVPHLAEEIWHILGKKESIIQTAWPKYDPAATTEEEILVVIQINGKLRDRMYVPASFGEDEVKQAALNRDRVRSFTNGKTIRKSIAVPGKLVNIVVS